MACCALGILSSEPANIGPMAEACCCEAAFLALMKHGDHAEVAETALSVLANFAEEAGCSAHMGSMGVCEVVALVTHARAVESLELAVLGCRAIGNLARGNRDNATRLEGAFAYEAVVRAIHAFPDHAPLALVACTALAHLASGITSYMQQAEALFNQFDADGSGSLDIEEFVNVLVHLKIVVTWESAKELLVEFDVDNRCSRPELSYPT